MKTKNPLLKQGLVVTPDSYEDIKHMINGLPEKYRVLGHTIVGMTWNFASKTIDEVIAEEQD